MVHLAFRIDPSSAEPLFAQLVAAVKRAVATGRIAAGEKLPSVRELAAELVINPNTIAKAYQALESEGVTVSRHGSGTFVAERRVTVRRGEQVRRLREALDALLSDAVHLGLPEDVVRTEFDDAIARYRFGKQAAPERASEEKA
jgi:GntR family transcriptional regulator